MLFMSSCQHNRQERFTGRRALSAGRIIYAEKSAKPSTLKMEDMMNFSFEHGFETDRVFLNRKSEEQGRINERLRNEFRAESARRCDADLAERWAKQEQEVNGATLGQIPTDDEMKGKYIGVPGVVPHPVKELLNNGHCPTCGADYTKPDVPYAHKSAAGNIMPGHTDTKQIHVSDVADWQNGAPKSKPTGLMAFEISTEQEFTEQIKDLLWHDDEYESKDGQVNERLIEAFRRGKDGKCTH
jgi:hypothetical protein